MYILAPRSALFVTTPRRPQKATRKVLTGGRRSPVLRRVKPPRVSPSPRHKVSRIHSYVGYLSPSCEAFDVALNSFVGGCACLCFALAFVPLFTFDESEELQSQRDDFDAIKHSLNSVLSLLPCINRTVERVNQTEKNFLGEMKRRTPPPSSSVMKRLMASIQKQQVALEDASSCTATCKGDGETQSSIPDVMVVMDIQAESMSQREVETAKKIAKLEEQFWENKTPTTKEC